MTGLKTKTMHSRLHLCGKIQFSDVISKNHPKAAITDWQNSTLIASISLPASVYHDDDDAFSMTTNFSNSQQSSKLGETGQQLPEYIAVDSYSKADIKTAHLAKIHCVAMAEQKRKLCIRGGMDIRTCYSVTTRCACCEHVDHIKFSLWVLPFAAFSEPECKKLRSLSRCISVLWQLWTTERVRRLRWKECKFGCYMSWTWWAAEQAAEFFKW